VLRCYSFSSVDINLNIPVISLACQNLS